MRIGYITPEETDPLAFYRGTGPLTHMRKNYDDVEYFTIPNNVTWAELRKCDVVLLQRPFINEHLKVVDMANKWNIPVVADFDDWLMDLAPSNPAYHAFRDKQQIISQICNMVDGIMVATEQLKTSYGKLLLDQNKPMCVVPNAYDVDLFKKYRNDKNKKERSKIFLWRGGTSHMEDLLSVKDDYRELFKKYPDWEFVFLAQHPWFLDVKEFKNVKTADPMNLIDYYRAIHDTAPAIMTHPLTDTIFNRGKSMCSWLEATHARAAYIGPDFEEFHRDGIFNYGKVKSFFDMAELLLNNPILIEENYQESEAYINANLTLDIINKKRYQFLKSFC